ncbi:MAG: DJ-1/PfpI family protein [Anaerolineae bacterium]|nr:DJ-1/PfpI family protein [Anaerolineae bacterium]
MTAPRNVAILIFDEVEVLDFAGPLEVFNVTAELNDPTPFNVYLVAETAAPIKTRGKLVIHPNYSLYTMPPADILLIPGGAGSRALLKKAHVLDWLRAQASRVEYLCSVCTGALVLAQAGLLVGVSATTHHDSLDTLRALVDERTIVMDDRRYVDNGHILTSGGVSAGIDMALYLVRQLLGDDVLKKTLSEMEYPWADDLTLTWRGRGSRL